MARYHIYTPAEHPNRTLAVGSLLSFYADATTSSLLTLYADGTTGTTLENPYTVPITGICDFWVEDPDPWVLTLGSTTRAPVNVNISVNAPVFLNVRDFGAAGNGVEDDSPAIQNAIDALGAGGGGTLYFPTGVYHLDAMLAVSAAGMVCRGEGMLSSVLQTDELNTLVKIQTLRDSFSFKDIGFTCDTAGDGTIKMVWCDLITQALSFSRCKFTLNDALRGAYTDTCLHLNNSYYSSIHACYFGGVTKVHPDPHLATGLECSQYQGRGIYSEGSNALYITDTTVHTLGMGINLHGDSGAHISGGAIESFDMGVLMDGGANNCSVRDVRFEHHHEETSQLYAYGVQYDVKMDTGCKDCLVDGQPLYEYPGLVPGYNMRHIDVDEKDGTNIVADRAPLPQVSCVRNGDFREWWTDGTNVMPSGWDRIGASTISRETSDLPPLVGICDAVKISAASNMGGIQTSAPFYWDPAKSEYVTVAYWMKQSAFDGTAHLRCGIWDLDNNEWLRLDVALAMYTGLTLANSSDLTEWHEYSGSLSPDDTGVAKNLAFAFGSYEAFAGDFYVAALRVLQGYYHHRVPPVFDSPRSNSLQAYAAWNPGSLADGAGESRDVAVTGAALGDHVSASFNVDLAGCVITAYVKSADTITVRLQNETAGVVDLAAGYLDVKVMKR